MDIREKADCLLKEFKKWAECQSHVQGVAVVGSFARGDFHLNSDVDLVVVSINKDSTLQQILSDFKYDEIARDQLEQWGPYLTSLRIFYKNELEGEYGVVTNLWVKEPLDNGTKNVVKNGFKILLDKEDVFSSVTSYLNKASGVRPPLS